MIRALSIAEDGHYTHRNGHYTHRNVILSARYFFFFFFFLGGGGGYSELLDTIQ